MNIGHTLIDELDEECHDVTLMEMEINEKESLKCEKQGVRNKKLGYRGETTATEFLQLHGYTILDRNWKCAYGEVDIVAEEDGFIVFVEVKTRNNITSGFPSESITPKKRAKYENIALAYLASHSCQNAQIRFDVISIVVLHGEKALLRHHINAFGVA